MQIFFLIRSDKSERFSCKILSELIKLFHRVRPDKSSCKVLVRRRIILEVFLRRFCKILHDKNSQMSGGVKNSSPCFFLTLHSKEYLMKTFIM